jgi:hypothetical protein
MLGRALRFASCAALATALLALVPTQAQAAEPLLTVVMHCDGNVDFTVTAPPGTDAARTNDSVTVSYRTFGDSPPVAMKTAHLGPDNGFTFSGSDFVLNFDQVDFITVQATANGPWGDGAPGGQFAETEDLTFPTNCGPAKPSATISVDPQICNQLDVTLRNDGDSPALFTTTGVDGKNFDDTVGPHSTFGFTQPSPEDQAVTVTVRSGSSVLATLTRTADCTPNSQPPAVPHAKVWWDCKGAHVQLDNSAVDHVTVFKLRRSGHRAEVIMAGAGVVRHIDFKPRRSYFLRVRAHGALLGHVHVHRCSRLPR